MPRAILDPKSPDSVVRVVDFPGMSPGTDQHANPPGMSWYQVNCVSLFPGELRVRRGFRVVRFDQPVRPEGLICTAGTVYTFASLAAAAGGDQRVVGASSSYVVQSQALNAGGLLPVDASSSYVMSGQAAIVGSFDLSGMF